MVMDVKFALAGALSTVVPRNLVRLHPWQSARNAPDLGIGFCQPSPGRQCSNTVLTPAAGQLRHKLRMCHHGLTSLILVNPVRALPTRTAEHLVNRLEATVRD